MFFFHFFFSEHLNTQSSTPSQWTVPCHIRRPGEAYRKWALPWHTHNLPDWSKVEYVGIYPPQHIGPEEIRYICLVGLTGAHTIQGVMNHGRDYETLMGTTIHRRPALQPNLRWQLNYFGLPACCTCPTGQPARKKQWDGMATNTIDEIRNLQSCRRGLNVFWVS